VGLRVGAFGLIAWTRFAAVCCNTTRNEE
jgi:hypothetical protein